MHPLSISLQCPSPTDFSARSIRALTTHMRPHIEAHLSGQLMGDNPSGWLRSQGFGTCEVCQSILSLRFNCRCPSCFHVVASSHSSPSGDSRPLAEGAPSIWDVFTHGPRVRSSVPLGARDAWSRCLIVALADVIAHRDLRSWTDLLTLPSLVLAAPSRGGRRHALRLDNDTRRRCLLLTSGHPIMAGAAGLARTPTRISKEMRFLTPSSLVFPLFSRRAPSAVPVPVSFRTLLSVLRARLSRICGLCTLRRMRMNVLVWVPCVVLRHVLPLSPMLIRFARPYTPSLPHRVLVVRGSGPPTFVTPCGRLQPTPSG